MNRHHGQHDDCYPCRLSSVQLSPSATPSRMNDVPPARTAYNRWEAGIATEERSGGHRIPLLNAKGHPIPIKTYVENRREIDAARERVRQDPTILTGGASR